MERKKFRKHCGEVRNVIFTVRLTQSERDRLSELADSQGVSVGAYLLGLALGDGSGAGPESAKPDPAQVSIGGF